MMSRRYALVVALGAQVQHGAAEQAPLHAGLDQQRQVAAGQHLERGDRAADVVRGRRTRAGSPAADMPVSASALHLRR